MVQVSGKRRLMPAENVLCLQTYYRVLSKFLKCSVLFVLYRNDLHRDKVFWSFPLMLIKIVSVAVVDILGKTALF